MTETSILGSKWKSNENGEVINVIHVAKEPLVKDKYTVIYRKLGDIAAFCMSKEYFEETISIEPPVVGDRYRTECGKHYCLVYMVKKLFSTLYLLVREDDITQTMNFVNDIPFTPLKKGTPRYSRVEEEEQKEQKMEEERKVGDRFENQYSGKIGILLSKKKHLGKEYYLFVDEEYSTRTLSCHEDNFETNWKPLKKEEDAVVACIPRVGDVYKYRRPMNSTTERSKYIICKVFDKHVKMSNIESGASHYPCLYNFHDTYICVEEEQKEIE